MTTEQIAALQELWNKHPKYRPVHPNNPYYCDNLDTVPRDMWVLQQIVENWIATVLRGITIETMVVDGVVKHWSVNTADWCKTRINALIAAAWTAEGIK